MNAEKLKLPATACASHPEEQRHLVVLFSTNAAVPFWSLTACRTVFLPLTFDLPESTEFHGFAVCLFASFRLKSHVILTPYLTDLSPRSVAHGMDHPSTRRDRPQLRNQFVRERRTLGRGPSFDSSRRSPVPLELHSLNFGIQAYAD